MTLHLNEIRDNSGARKTPKCLGRGMGSGKGKTSGRGGKGQTARSGVSINGFEGGQNPIYRRMPKRGFNNIHAISLYELNFTTINRLVKSNKIDPKQPVDIALLMDINVIKDWYQGISLVNTGVLDQPITLKVTRATKGAAEAVKKAGGEIIIA